MFSNRNDVIDSRDVIERIAELKDEIEGLATDSEELGEAMDELATLEALQAEAEDYAPDWRHGEALIRDSYFTDYAREYAEDIGELGSMAAYIDWDRFASDLQMDYTSVDFDGVTYWIRS